MKAITTKLPGFKIDLKRLTNMALVMILAMMCNPILAQYTLQDDDVLIENGVILECYYNYEQLDIIIPSTLQGQIVKGITDGSDAFRGVFGWKGLTSLQLPKTIEFIGNYSIRDNEFTTLDLSGCDKLERIGNEAVCRNKSMESVDFTGCTALTEIGGSAFRLCLLSEIDLTPCVNLDYIGSSAFRENSITSVDITECNRLMTIGISAFRTNPGLDGVILPDVDTAGYSLAYWEASTSNTNLWEMAAGDSLTDFTALYKARMETGIYSITYNADGGIHSNDTSYTMVDSVIFSAASKEGYEFLGWYDNEELSEEPVTMIDSGSWGDVELWASFEAINYIITYNADGGIHTNPTEYNIESNIALANATKEGYTFLGWFGNAELTGDVVTELTGMTGDIELWAAWQEGVGVSNSLSSEVNVYPNPVAGNLVIDYNGLEIKEIALVSVSGQFMFADSKPGLLQTSIDVSSYDAGIYYVIISKTNGVTLNKKVIKVD